MLNRLFVVGVLFVLFLTSVRAMEVSDVEIHGFASMGYLKSSDNNYMGNSDQGSFEFNEFAINFRADVAERTDVGIQFFSRDLGDLGNNEIVIDWGFVDQQFNDKIGVRVGRVKIPAMLYNEYQDIDAARTTILMPQGVYSLGFRDTAVAVDGVNVYGNLETPSMGDFEYSAYYGSLNIPKDGSIAKLLGTAGIESAMKYATGASIIYNTPFDSLRFSASFFYIKDWNLSGDIITFVPDFFGPGLGVDVVTSLNMNTSSFMSKSISVEYTLDDWVFAAEYMVRDGTFSDVTTNATLFDVNWGTWYLQGDYRFNDKWSCAAYYMEYLDNRDDSNGSNSTPQIIGWQDETVFAVRYDVNDAWNIKTEFHYINGVALVDLADNPNGVKESWALFALKSTVSF